MEQQNRKSGRPFKNTKQFPVHCHEDHINEVRGFAENISNNEIAEEWEYVLEKLNSSRDSTQELFTIKNTPKSLYMFWVDYRKNN